MPDNDLPVKHCGTEAENHQPHEWGSDRDYLCPGGEA